MTTLKIIRPGATVCLCDDANFLGVVNQVAIKAGDHVEYQVIWWDGRTRKDAWMESHEVQLPHMERGEVQQIGFLT